MDESKIKIGGKEYSVKLYYFKAFKILKKYNAVYSRRVAQFEKQAGRGFDPLSDKLFMPDMFFFWAVFILLDKRGFWPFRFPFRSVRHLSKNILRNEAVEIVKFIGESVLYTRSDVEPEPAKKNE